MNETLQTILQRRSVRRYKPDAVPPELIAQIVEAGTYAPTGMNRQSPIILAISNPEVRNRLSRLNAAILGTDSDPFYGAPVVLVVLARKDMPTHIYDGTLVMQNLMLAAASLGLGTCWIHRAKEEFEMPEGKQLLRSLGIADEYEGIGHCIVGYPQGEATGQGMPRKENYAYFI